VALINFRYREIAAKIAYCGGLGADSTMSVRTLHGMVSAREKGRLFPFGPAESELRAWFFEYVPPGVIVPGFTLKVRVYALPMSAGNAPLREEVLGGADAVMLVVDPRSSRQAANRNTLADLQRALKHLGQEPGSIPLLLQRSQTDFGEEGAPQDYAKLLGVESNVEPVDGIQEFFGFHDRVIGDIGSRLRANLAGDLGAITLVADHRESMERDHEVLARHEAALEQDRARERPSLEMAIKDVQAALQARYAGLSQGIRVEIPFQPKEFVGTRPVHVLGATLDGEHVHVDIVMERMNGGEPRRLLLQLANRPRDATPMPRNTQPGPPSRDAISSTTLPERVDLGPPEPADFPPVWYGVAGAAGGMLIGLLVGFLLFG
jgi:hypothetical protein